MNIKSIISTAFWGLTSAATIASSASAGEIDLDKLSKIAPFEKNAFNNGSLGSTEDDFYCLTGELKSFVEYSEAPDFSEPEVGFEDDEIHVTFATRSNYTKVEYIDSPTPPIINSLFHTYCVGKPFLKARRIAEVKSLTWKKTLNDGEVAAEVADKIRAEFLEHSVTLETFMLDSGRELIFGIMENAAADYSTTFNGFNTSISTIGNGLNSLRWSFPIPFASSTEEERLATLRAMEQQLLDMQEELDEDTVAKMVTMAPVGATNVVWGSAFEYYSAGPIEAL